MHGLLQHIVTNVHPAMHSAIPILYGIETAESAMPPPCRNVLSLRVCCPAAQNLVLMMQLQSGTASLAPATARLLLQMYTLAVLPVTLWVSVFAKLVL
jgi:hypothetical protein